LHFAALTRAHLLKGKILEGIVKDMARHPANVDVQHNTARSLENVAIDGVLRCA
jgi:hypothetical protein